MHVTPSQCHTQDSSRLVCYSAAHKKAVSLYVTPNQCRTQKGSQLTYYTKPVPRVVSLHVTLCTQEGG